MEKANILENRKYMIGGIILAIVAIYIFRLAQLQLISDEYKTKADSNAYYRSVIFPSRGNIYDRHGKLLVYNQQAYDIMVTMREIHNLDTLELCKTLGMTKDAFVKRMEDIKNRDINPGYSSYSKQLFMGQLTEQDYSVIQEKLIRYPGFSIRKRTVRKYTYPYLAHVLGDVGQVSPEDIENDDYYAAGDFIGKQGVERSYEKELPGGVFHCFTGNQREAEELLSFDRFVLGVGGVSTFKSSHLREDLPAVVPLHRLVLETDSPYMAPVPHRGKRNESAYVVDVMRTLAVASLPYQCGQEPCIPLK